MRSKPIAVKMTAVRFGKYSVIYSARPCEARYLCWDASHRSGGIRSNFDVRGNYDGETNGRDIGETAHRSCTGSWFITPSHLKTTTVVRK